MPRRPTLGPNRGHSFSPPSDPERTVRPSSAAVMHGPSFRVTYWISSICDTNGWLAARASTRVLDRSVRSSVTPAPSAPGIAHSANVATRSSTSGNPMIPMTRPARSSRPARKSAASAPACSGVGGGCAMSRFGLSSGLGLAGPCCAATRQLVSQTRRHSPRALVTSRTRPHSSRRTRPSAVALCAGTRALRVAGQLPAARWVASAAGGRGAALTASSTVG